MLPVPRRRRGMEFLEEPGVEPALVERSLRDVALANRLFGGVGAVLAELRPLFAGLAARGRSDATLLDVGTGMGDIPARARQAAAAAGLTLHVLGLDASETLARIARTETQATVCADALALPFADRSVDIVTCSQLLHHFADGDTHGLLRECDRVARERVVVSELRRSWTAAAGIWLASFPLGFHPVSRHDGVISVLRGFTATELRAHALRATGVPATVVRRAGWRVTASWTPNAHAARSPA